MRLRKRSLEGENTYYVTIKKTYDDKEKIITEEKIDETTIELQFNVIDTKYNLNFEYDTTNGKEIYIMPIGKFTYFDKPSRTIFYFNINKDTERVFLKDKKGNIKEIWNKDNGIYSKVER